MSDTIYQRIEQNPRFKELIVCRQGKGQPLDGQPFFTARRP